MSDVTFTLPRKGVSFLRGTLREGDQTYEYFARLDRTVINIYRVLHDGGSIESSKRKRVRYQAHLREAAQRYLNTVSGPFARELEDTE